MIDKNIIIGYPKPGKTFKVYTDASDAGYGGVITQDNIIINLYSVKFNNTQRKYTTGEKELFSITKCLQFNKRILFGEKIIVYTDHHNLLYNAHTNSRIDRWKLLIQEFDINYNYISGFDNVMANQLSRLNFKIAKEKKELLAIQQPDIFSILKYDNYNKGIQKDFENINLFIDDNKRDKKLNLKMLGNKIKRLLEKLKILNFLHL